MISVENNKKVGINMKKIVMCLVLLVMFSSTCFAQWELVKDNYYIDTDVQIFTEQNTFSEMIKFKTKSIDINEYTIVTWIINNDSKSYQLLTILTYNNNNKLKSSTVFGYDRTLMTPIANQKNVTIFNRAIELAEKKKEGR